MLKKLKQEKEGGKKQTKKKQQPKKEEKKVEDEEEEQTEDMLVEIKTDSKPNKSKNVKKVINSKLNQVEIDTSTIVIQKKQKVVKIQKWGATEQQAKQLMEKRDFNTEEHDTEFMSLTDQKKNQQLKEKAKKEAAQNKPKVQQIAGIKYAPLVAEGGSKNTGGPDDTLTFKKNPTQTGITGNIPLNTPVFTNSKLNGQFATIAKSASQLREQQMQRKMEQRFQQQALKPKEKQTWFSKKVQTKPVIQMKPSAWATKANQVQVVQQKFAPLQKSEQQKRMQGGRREQEFVFVSKKQQEQRKLAKLAKEQQAVVK